MALFFYEYYEAMKDYFHPNVLDFIDRYTDDEGLASLPPFHGCKLKNRNGSRKLIDYRNGKNVFVQYGVMTAQNSRAAYFPLLGTGHKVKTNTFLRTKETAFLFIR